MIYLKKIILFKELLAKKTKKQKKNSFENEILISGQPTLRFWFLFILKITLKNVTRQKTD